MVLENLTIIQGGRGFGKTTRVVNWVKEDPRNRAIVVLRQEEAQRLRAEFGLDYENVVVHSEHKHVGGYRRLAFDNIDFYFHWIFSGRLQLATTTQLFATELLGQPDSVPLEPPSPWTETDEARVRRERTEKLEEARDQAFALWNRGGFTEAHKIYVTLDRLLKEERDAL